MEAVSTLKVLVALATTVSGGPVADGEGASNTAAKSNCCGVGAAAAMRAIATAAKKTDRILNMYVNECRDVKVLSERHLDWIVEEGVLINGRSGRTSTRHIYVLLRLLFPCLRLGSITRSLSSALISRYWHFEHHRTFVQRSMLSGAPRFGHKFSRERRKVERSFDVKEAGNYTQKVQNPRRGCL